MRSHAAENRAVQQQRFLPLQGVRSSILDPSIDAVFEIEFVFSVSSPFEFEHSLAIAALTHAIQQVGRRRYRCHLYGDARQ